MKSKRIFLISALSAIAVFSGGCANEDKVANDIRKATKTAEPYDYNYDLSDMKEETRLGERNGNGYWNYDRDDTNAKDTARRMKDQVKNDLGEVTNSINAKIPNDNVVGGKVLPNTATDSRYKNSYLYGNNKSEDYIVNPVVLGN